MNGVALRRGVVGVLALGIAVAAVLVGDAILQVRSEVQGLRAVRGGGTIVVRRGLPRAGPTAEADGAERERLERVVAALRRQLAELEAQLSRSGPAKPSGMPMISAEKVFPGFVGREQLVNAGRATPAALMQTLWWAFSRRDAAAAAECLVVEPRDLESVRQLFSSLPPGVRERIGSPDLLAVHLLMLTMGRTSLAPGASPLQVGTAESFGGTADVLQRGRIQLGDGSLPDAKLRFRPGPTGWRWVVPKSEVDLMIRTLGNLPAAQWDFLGR